MHWAPDAAAESPYLLIPLLRDDTFHYCLGEEFCYLLPRTSSPCPYLDTCWVLDAAQCSTVEGTNSPVGSRLMEMLQVSPSFSREVGT